MRWKNSEEIWFMLIFCRKVCISEGGPNYMPQTKGVKQANRDFVRSALKRVSQTQIIQ